MTDAVRILVVDDSPAIRQVLGSILRAAGCEVETADGVRNALRRLRTFRAEVILTDFNMPQLNGEVLVRLVRRDERLADLPIFVVSSEDDTGIHERVLAAGADAWFDKPVDVQGLIRTIRAVVEAPRSTPSVASRPTRQAALGGAGEAAAA